METHCRGCLVRLGGPFVLMEIVGKTACPDRKTAQQDGHHYWTRWAFSFVALDCFWILERTAKPRRQPSQVYKLFWRVCVCEREGLDILCLCHVTARPYENTGITFKTSNNYNNTTNNNSFKYYAWTPSNIENWKVIVLCSLVSWTQGNKQIPSALLLWKHIHPLFKMASSLSVEFLVLLSGLVSVLSSRFSQYLCACPSL